MAFKSKAKKDQQGDGFHLFAVRILEKIVDFLRDKMTVKLLDFSITWLSKIGHFGLIVAAGIGFVFAIVAAIKQNSFSAFMMGLGWVVAVFVVQYTAHRFSSAGDTLIANNPTSLASKAFLDCFAFLALLAGVAVFIADLVIAIRAESLMTFLTGLGTLIFCWFLALIAFNPDTISTTIVEEASAGQEAIGIVTFFIKQVLRLIPIIFGIGIVVFTILLFVDFFGLFSSTKFQAAFFSGTEDASQVIFFGLLPFFGYLFFVFAFLTIDIIRAILDIPGKLDKLKK